MGFDTNANLTIHVTEDVPNQVKLFGALVMLLPRHLCRTISYACPSSDVLYDLQSGSLLASPTKKTRSVGIPESSRVQSECRVCFTPGNRINYDIMFPPLV